MSTFDPARNVGVDSNSAFVQKPFALESLGKAVRQVLDAGTT